MTDRFWIAEIPGRAIKTVIIKATSRKEAEMKLRSNDFNDDIEGIDVSFKQSGIGRILCEDGKS